MTTTYEFVQPLIAGQAYTFYASVFDQDSPNPTQTSVTIAAGDFTVFRDGVSLGNMDNLPTETGATGILTFTLSAAETTGCTKFMLVKAHDALGDEWQDAEFLLPVMQAVTISPLDAAGVRGAVGLAAANLDTQLSEIVEDTAEIGTAGAGLTAVPWNSSWDAEVQSEVQDALEANDLDHLIQVSAGSEEPTDGSYLDQIMHKDGLQTFNAATDSLEALSDKLTRSAATASVDADELTVIRGDTYDSDADNAITGLGDISTRTKLWIVVKKSANQTDTQATLFCEETDGITRLNGAAYGTAAHSVITVSDEAAGDIRWQLDEAVTDDLAPGLYYYDIQTLDVSGNVKTWRRMKQFTVQADVAKVIA